MKIIKEVELVESRPKIIAIDFDQTIVAGNSFPDPSKCSVLEEAKKFINLLHREGYYIIIWTCRYLKKDMKSCIDFLKINEIEYDAFNENYYGLTFNPLPKIYYDYIIDDKDHFVVDWLKEYKKIRTLFCNDLDGCITPEMKDFFFTRTENHINSVITYVQRFFNKKPYPPESCFFNKYLEHDYSKYTDFELSPYIVITWNYHCKDIGLDFLILDNIRNKMNEATEHHIRENLHHPEYWCPDKYARDLIAKNERDKFNPDSMPIVDATAMPEKYLVEMCADWCATAQERRNTPFEWADKVINHRWKFTKDQTILIYKVLDTMWK